MNECQEELTKLLKSEINRNNYQDDIMIDNDCLASIFNQLKKPELIKTIKETSHKTGYEFNVNAIRSGEEFIPGCISINAHKVSSK